MGLISIDSNVWKQGKQQLLNLFLSSPCALCQRPAPAALCPGCERQIRQTQLSDPLYQGQAGLPVISWGAYEGALKQSIASLKYNHRQDVAQFLGTELARAWLSSVAAQPRQSNRSWVVMPVPLHQSRLQQRGFNQAEALAQWFCRVTGMALYSNILKRVRATQAMHSLNRQDRLQNLVQAFAVDDQHQAQLQSARVWLIDDIFTTGATAIATSQVLRRYGISVAGICTVARTLAVAETQSAKTRSNSSKTGAASSPVNISK